MKKALVLASAMLFVASTAMAQGLTGTGHDFTSVGWSGGDVCAPCHTPHSTLTTDAPLWNHEATISTFDLYGVGSTTMDATVTQPTDASAACLGCHDGVTALDAFNGQETVADGLTTVMTDNPIYGPGDNKTALVGTSLTNDHPVSISYDEADAGDLWLNPSTDPGVAALLRNGQVQCSSCHEPHNQGADAAYGFLRVDNSNSAMCTTCHNKL